MRDGLRVRHVGVQVEQLVHGPPAARRQLVAAVRRRRPVRREHRRVRALVQRAVPCGQGGHSRHTDYGLAYRLHKQNQ